MTNRMFVFDFDGTLADSYACLPEVYASIADHVGLQGEKLHEFANQMVRREDQQDLLGNYDRHAWWPAVFEQFGIRISEKQLMKLVRMYWKQRAIKSKVMDHTEETLKWLKARGILAIACRSDGKYGNKKERIQESGLAALFNKVVIVGQDVENFTQALQLLMTKYDINRDKVMFFDDKPFAINEISENLQNVTTVTVNFKGTLRSAWAQQCTPTYRIRTINEAARIAES